VVVQRLCEDGGAVVIAAGGGAPAHGDNLARMLAAGVVIGLASSPDEILKRIGDLSSRPLLANAPDPRAEVARLLAAREAAYGRAHLIVDTAGLAPSQVVQKIAEALGC
jgi:shikimate kinase